VLELAILGLLKEHPMHGYQLSRELSDAHGPFWRVSYGSLYPSLRRLERGGAIEATTPDGTASGETARSMAGGANKKATKGRRKTVYRITAAGEELFLDLLQETPHEGQSEDTRFRIRLAFFRYLSPEARIRLLERRRAALEGRLTAITDALRSTTTQDDYQRSLMEHGRLATESDIAWLTGLIQAERSKSGTGTPRYRGSERRATATLRRKERTG
jgi:DNA-binding PadR family transcriptional regulator